jgi:hypothetical protein
VRIGVLVTGDIAVRAAHSLNAHSGIDEVAVIGPARSKSFRVLDSADGCDFLIGTGPKAITRARDLGVPLIWDGEKQVPGVAVWGGSPQGLTLALASRETDPRLVAVAHPELEEGSDHRARFPEPIGQLEVVDGTYGGMRLAAAASPNEFAAALAIGADRRVTVVDHGAFMSGIALAAAVDIANDTPKAVWDDALPYLRAATAMGLVMAED